MTRLEEVGRVRHLLLLRERLGMDTNPNPTTKTEKDVCNLAARASASPIHMIIPPSPQTPIKEQQSIISDREYTQKEQELLLKCVRLIQGVLIVHFIRTVEFFSNFPNNLFCFCFFFKSQIGRGKNEKNENTNQSDVSPGDEGCADLTTSCISGNSIE